MEPTTNTPVLEFVFARRFKTIAEAAQFAAQACRGMTATGEPLGVFLYPGEYMPDHCNAYVAFHAFPDTPLLDLQIDEVERR